MLTRLLILVIVCAAGLLAAPSISESFTATGNMNATRADHTATLLNNGKVLITGGNYILNSSSPSGTPHFLNTAEIYYPVAGTFTATGSMTIARAYHTATLLPNGKVLITGGSDSFSGNSFATAEIYDPATGLFTPTGGMTAV